MSAAVRRLEVNVPHGMTLVKPQDAVPLCIRQWMHKLTKKFPNDGTITPLTMPVYFP